MPTLVFVFDKLVGSIILLHVKPLVCISIDMNGSDRVALLMSYS